MLMNLKSFFTPPKPILWINGVVSVLALRYSLMNLPPQHPVSVFSYILSTYTLTALVLIAVQLIQHLLKDYEPRTAAGRILWDREKRGLAAMVCSSAYNLIFALIYLVPGIRNKVLWDSSVGVYYLVLCCIRSYLLYHTAKKDKTGAEQVNIFRICAVMLLVLDLFLGLRAYQITWKNIATPKNQIFTIAVAAWTFFSAVTCIIRVIQNRKIKSYLISSDIAVKFATVLVSIFNLQASMIVSFGNDPVFSHWMNLITGNVVFVLIFLECVWMLKKESQRPAV